MRKTCLSLVHELAKADPRVVFIGSDLGAGTMKDFARDFPERCFMEGVSEAHVIGMAAGLALDGRIPYVNTIASFLTRRCFEQVALDLCLHRLPVRLIGNGGGLVYAPLGPTHQTVEDLATFRALPGMTILAPADADDMRRLMPLTLDLPGPVYIRLAKGFDPIVTTDAHPRAIGRAVPVREGRDVLLCVTGVLLGPCLEAAALLAAAGVQTGVLYFHTVKPFDAEALCARAAQARAVLTVEEHSVIGGLGGAAAETLLEAGILPPRGFRRLGIPDSFAEETSSQAALLSALGLDAPGIAAAARTILSAAGR